MGEPCAGEVSGQPGRPGLVNFEPRASRSNLKVSLGMIRRRSNGRLAMKHLSRNHQVASKTGRRLGLKGLWKLWKNSFRDVLVDKGFTHAAAIAYYAIVSMFPLLLLL